LTNFDEVFGGVRCMTHKNWLVVGCVQGYSCLVGGLCSVSAVVSVLMCVGGGPDLRSHGAGVAAVLWVIWHCREVLTLWIWAKPYPTYRKLHKTGPDSTRSKTIISRWWTRSMHVLNSVADALVIIFTKHWSKCWMSYRLDCCTVLRWVRCGERRIGL